MKLALINPYFRGDVFAPSLGLGFIGTYIKKNSDCEVKVIEPALEKITEKQVLSMTQDADIVGLTCYTESRFQCFNFAKKVKENNPNCRIIVGGHHISSLDIKILEYYPFVDVVVRGEGENSLLDIIKGKNYRDILGITFREDNKIVRQDNGVLINKIDSLHYDYSLIKNVVKNWKDLEVSNRLFSLTHLPIIASRGCPYRCAFCGSYRHWGKVWRGISPEELVDRIGYLVKQYKAGYFRFYDAIFIGDDERIINFCELMKKKNIKIKFRIDIRVGTSKEALKILKEAGCEIVGFGIESGSDKILRRINKGINVEQTKETIKICRELNYWMIGFFMISLPDETKEDIEKTISFFKYFDVINLQFFKVHTNTTIYDELKENGEISDDIWFDENKDNEILYCKENFKSANFLKEEIDRIIENVNFPKLEISKFIKSSLMQPHKTLNKIADKIKSPSKVIHFIKRLKI